MRQIVYTATTSDQANGYTPTIPTDVQNAIGRYGLQYLTSAGSAGAGTMQASLDSPFSGAAMTWFTAALTAGRNALYEGGVTAFRVLTPTSGDVITINEVGRAI